MLAFDRRAACRRPRSVCDRVQLFLLAASLGGVESLVVLPAYTSHYNMSEEEFGARRRDSGDGARVHRHRGRRGSHR